MHREFSKLPLVVAGKTIISPCVEVMALSVTSKADGAAGYLGIYEAFMGRYGEEVRHYRLNDSAHWKPWKPKDRNKVPSWFGDARTLRQPLLGITMHTQPSANELHPPLLEMFFDHASAEYPRGMVRIALPVESVEASADALLGFIDEALAEFPLHWGTAGYAFQWDGNDTAIEKYADAWLGGHLLQHPGLATGDLMSWGLRVEKGISTVGWLTFVGDALIDQLGGRDALVKRLIGTGVGLRSYSRGLALQAGARPELGNVNRKNVLPLHREVGRLLAPVFAPDDVLEKVRVTGIKDPEARLAWLRRFLP